MQRCSQKSNSVKTIIKETNILGNRKKICQKRNILHKAAQLKESSPTQMNINKFINAQEFLVYSYDLEQKNYINKNIYEI